MAVSLKDISLKTHINICSVSQVLNNHPRALRLREETREKILAAARELGYCRNEAAASIRRKKSNVLAFVTSEMGSIEYTGRIQNGVLDAASNFGYTITIHRLSRNTAKEIAEKLLGWRVAGVIFHVANLASIKEIREILEKESIPWGTVNLSNPGGIGFTSNDREGVIEAVRFLTEEGHKRIAYFANSDKIVNEYQINRMEGYKSGLKRFLPHFSGKSYFLNDPALLPQSEAAGKFLDAILRDKMDAVICESDLLALFLIRGASLKNISIPEKLSLIGFGDGLLAENASPPLTTVHQDFVEMGEATVKALVKRITSRKSLQEEKCPMFGVKLIQRASTRTKIKK